MNEAYRQYLLAGERAGMRYALAVPRAVSAQNAGLHLGQQAGSSLEFQDYRDYQPGDDLRNIDWNAYARSDRLTVRLYREEISPHLDIVIDGSRSMALSNTAKVQAAIGLAALFAVASENAGYSHNAWLAAEACHPIRNAQARPTLWGDITFEHRGNPLESFLRLPPVFRRQGMRIFISDLLWLESPMTLLQRLANGASGVVIVQVLAAQDANPPERGRLRLVDSETDEQREIMVDEAAVRRYQEALTRHQQNWRRACQQTGAGIISLIAEEVVDDWKLESLVVAEILKM